MTVWSRPEIGLYLSPRLPISNTFYFVIPIIGGREQDRVIDLGRLLVRYDYMGRTESLDTHTFQVLWASLILLFKYNCIGKLFLFLLDAAFFGALVIFFEPD